MDESEGNNLEILIDRILISARGLKNKLDQCKSGNTEEVNFSQRARELEIENGKLKRALEDHQYGLEFIMCKYRSHVQELMQLNKR